MDARTPAQLFAIINLVIPEKCTEAREALERLASLCESTLDLNLKLAQDLANLMDQRS